MHQLQHTATHCNTLQHAHTIRQYSICMFPHPGTWRVASVADAVGSMSELSPYNTAYTAIFNMNILTPYVLTPYYLQTKQPTQQ